MGEVLPVYKPAGLTSLQTLDRLREVYPEYRKATLSYAGILDPLAEGVLLVLVGEENKRREVHTGLDKEYEADVLFGVATDTFDIMGKVVQSGDPGVPVEMLSKALLEHHGTFLQKYPPYSSVRVSGRSLFEWARDGRLDEIIIPEKERTVYALECIGSRTLSREGLLKYVVQEISRVHGDFRQEEVMESWREYLDTAVISDFPVVRIRVRCSSGTYIRGIADSAGRSIGCGAVALHICRTQAGEYRIADALMIQ